MAGSAATGEMTAGEGSSASGERIALVVYRAGELEATPRVEDLPALVQDGRSVTWVDLTDPAARETERVCEALGLHPLIAEDIIDTEARSKLERVGDVLHVVLFALSRDGAATLHEIDFVLGRRFLLSVHPSAIDLRSSRRVRAGLEPLLEHGPDALLWALMDGVVDGYFPVFDQLADEIDELQDRIIERPDHAALERVFAIKRELVGIRHAVAPAREVLNQLTTREFDLIAERQIIYFRDIYDHLVRLTDEFDSFRELATTTIDVYLSTVNNNLGVIMKRLTGVTVILAGIAAVSGIFGMSEAGPVLAGTEGTGFWLIAIVAVVGAAVAVVILRRLDWV